MEPEHKIKYEDIPDQMKTALKTAEALFDPTGDNLDFIVIVHGINNTRSQFSYPHNEVDEEMKSDIARRMLLLSMNQNVTHLVCMFEAHRMEVPPELSEQLDPSVMNISRAIEALREAGIDPVIEEILSVNCDSRDGNYLAMAKVERDENNVRTLCDWSYSFASNDQIREAGHYPLLMGLFVQGENLKKSMSEKLDSEHQRLEKMREENDRPKPNPELDDVVEILKAKLPEVR